MRFVALAVSFSLTTAVLGQEASPLEGRDASQGVFVRDSATVLERFTLAERMERLRDWDNAADVYQGVLREYADRVVPSRTDDDNNITQYRSVVPAIQERIARWPAEGLAVFRELYEDDAARLLEAAVSEPDPVERRRQLARVLNEYFVTATALDAGRLLIDESFRDGDFASAAALADRILETYPGLGSAQPDFAFRAGLSYHLLGQKEQAAEQLNTLPENATGLLGGEDVNYREALSAALLQAPPTERPTATLDWPMAFGAPDRHVIPGEPNPEQLHRSFRIPLADAAPRAVQPIQVRRYRGELETLESLGELTGVMPVIDRGEMFFHDNAALHAVSMVSGAPLPGWEQTHTDGVYRIEAWSKPRGLLNTLAVSNTSVVAVMGKADYIAERQTGQSGFAEQLVCLNREDGSVRWTLAPTRITFQSGGEEVSVVGGRFAGSPIISNGRIYLKLTGSSNANAGQFEECYALCIDEQTGNIRWGGFVASNASDVMFNNGNTVGQRGMGESHPALDGDRIYVSNDAGVIACLDAYDGTIRWLNLYERELPDNANNRFGRQPVRRLPDQYIPATSNPLLITQGKVFAVPVQGKDAVVYDALSGNQVFSVDLEKHGDLNQLIGVVNDQFILGNVHRVDAIAWTDYDPQLEALDNVHWNIQIAGDGVAILGRPVIAGDHLYYCSPDKVMRLELRGGKREIFMPAGGSFGDDQGPGNLLVLGDTVVLATPRQVDVYADPITIQKDLERLVRESPNDVVPRLRFAESAAVSGDAEAVLVNLREAVRIVTNLNDPADPARARTFAAIMGMADRDVEGVARDELFGLAETIAASPQQQVRLRLTRIDASEDPAVKVALYQQLLSDAALRGIVVNVAGESINASELGRRRIDALIAENGRGVYDAVEAHAVAAAAPLLGQPDGDPAALLELARQYPNAAVSGEMLSVASDRLEARGDVVLARRALRESLSRAQDNAARADLLERLARTMGGEAAFLQLAAAHLSEAGRLQPGSELRVEMPLPDGAVLPIMPRTEAAQKLRELATVSANARLPVVDLPPMVVNGSAADPFPQRSEIERVRLLIPHLDGGERNDRLVVWGGTTRLFNVTGEEIATLDFASRPSAVAWFSDTLVLLGNDHIAGFNGTTGEALWQIAPLLPDDQQALAAQPVVEELAPDAEPPVIQLNDGQINPQNEREFAMLRDRAQANDGPMVRGGTIRLASVAPDRLAVASELGEAVMIDPVDGSITWRRGVDNGQAVRMVAGPNHLALLIKEPTGQQRLVVRSNFDGGVVLEQLGGNEPLVNFNLSDDGLLLLLTDQHLRAFDLTSVDGPAPAALWDTEFRERMGNAPFTRSFSPNHLQVSAGKVLVLGDSNTASQAIYVFDLATGVPMKYPDSEAPVALSPRAGEGEVRLITSGSRVIAVGKTSLVAYDFAQAGREWERFRGSRQVPEIRDVMLTADAAIVVDEPNAPVQGRSRRPNQLTLSTVTRMSDNGDDGGLVMHERPIAEDSGIETGQWRVVDGGFVYVTGQGKLVLLRTAS